jgi:hypothetical protein
MKAHDIHGQLHDVVHTPDAAYAKRQAAIAESKGLVADDEDETIEETEAA